MGIDRDVMPRGNFDNFQMMLDLPLAIVPFHRGRPWRRARRDDAARVGDIAGIHRLRSEERGAGQECVSTCRYRWPPFHENKNNESNTTACTELSGRTHT